MLFQPRSVKRSRLVYRLAGTRATRFGYRIIFGTALPVAPGEHRFAYILDGERQMADPTLPALEQDDFGGENSILSVGLKI